MRKLQVTSGTVTGEFIYRHHVEPTVKLYVPKGETLPIPNEVHRRYQNNTYITGRNVGRTDWRLLERRFGETLKRPVIPFGSPVEYYPTSAKDQNPSIWKESLTWIVPRIRFVRGGEFGRVT